MNLQDFNRRASGELHRLTTQSSVVAPHPSPRIPRETAKRRPAWSTDSLPPRPATKQKTAATSRRPFLNPSTPRTAIDNVLGHWERCCLCNLSRVWCFPNVCLGSHQHQPSQLRVERVQRSQGPVIVAGQRYGTGHGKAGDRNVCLADYQENRPADVIVGLLCPMPSPVPGAILERANTLPPAPPQGITDQTTGTGETKSLLLVARPRDPPPPPLSIAGRHGSTG